MNPGKPLVKPGVEGLIVAKSPPGKAGAPKPEKQAGSNPPASAFSPGEKSSAAAAPSRKILAMDKPFRLGEFLIERSIQAVAFVSLLFILLIFVFIFREAVPLFTGHATTVTGTEEVGASETYGEDVDAPIAVENPELAQKQEVFKVRKLLEPAWQPVSLEPK